MLNSKLKHFPVLLALFISSPAFAATVADDFTQATVNDSPGSPAAYAGSTSPGNGLNWQTEGYACLTAGISSGTNLNNSTTVLSTKSTYSNIPGCDLMGTVPSADAAGSGALRLTSGVNSTGTTGPGNQASAIVSGGTFPSDQGLQVTFTTYTYAGNSGGSGHEGADGIGFFLQDGSVGTTLTLPNASVIPNIGAYGGSLGYSCSQSKGSGLTGAYLGLGMDEYGNFLNSGDNTSTGIPAQATDTGHGANNFGSGTYQSNRIGLRGAGNVSWYWLNKNYPNLYPTSLPTSGSNGNQQLAAVENTCSTNALYNYSGNTIGSVSNGSSMGVTSYGNGPTLLDYPVIPNGYYVLPATNLIANESATTRANATPITYRLIITPGGLLSFMYSYNGGAYSSVLTNFPITTSNGPLPSTFRFGFAGSTGGSNNVHEISCFVAEPVQSSTSAGANTIQSGQVRTGTQVYFASYNPNGWSGSLVSKAIVNTSGVLTINTTADWDGNCVLTGGTCPNTGIAIATPEVATYSTTSRQLLTWNGSAGVSLEWANLTTTATTGQQAILNSTDSNGTNRLNWLRGDRSQEQANAGPLRTRGGVLGDIVDSSPLWVGPPSLSYTSPFPDFLYATAVTPPENASGAQAYTAYASSLLTRMNVVYAGGNDGLLHGFRAGHNNSDGSYNEQANNPDGIANDGLNDGRELIGFMPSTVLASANVVGLTNPTYGHNYFVDAPPGTGDLFYNKAWHSWLVGGVGPGGAEIYALDVSDPAGTVTTSSQFSEPNASNLVIGDWTSSTLTTLTCANALANCGNNLGNTYGTPLIRRLHNGQWAIIFGNGLGSTNNHAGVFIGLVNSSTGAVNSFYWLDTGVGSSSSPDGIAYVASADLDGDHITDYLYAGDLLGNLWRFDLTSSNPADWGASTFGHTSATPLFTATSSTGTVQPITTKVAVTATIAGGQLRVLLGFGTGQANPFTTTMGVKYASGKQTVYGIWDWDMNLWNNGATTTNNVTIPPSTSPYAALAEVRSTAPTTYQTSLVTRANLLQDTSTETGATITVPATRTMAISTVSWCNSSTCSTPNNQYGWYYDLPDTVTSTACGGSVCDEQLIYSPVFSGGALLFNSTIPATTTLGQCSPSLPASWTNGLDMASGGGFAQNFFPDPNGNLAVTSGYNSITGIKQDSVGTPYVVAIGSKQYAVNPNANGAGNINQINPQGGVVVTRKTWEEIR